LILTSDYDTQASFYAVKKACEPVYVQLDLSNYNVAVDNTTNAPLNGLSVSARIYSLDDKLLQREERRDAVADAVTEGYKLDLAPLLTSNGILFVKLFRCCRGRAGESREIKIEYPMKSGNGEAQLAIRGWNLSSQIVQVASSGS
jgi:hypothetical protein